MPILYPVPGPAAAAVAVLNTERVQLSKAPLQAVAHAPPLRWEYDTFLKEVESDNIERAEFPQDQKTVRVKFRDGSTRSMVLPTGYDHIGLMRAHDVQIKITQSVGPAAFSVVDIMLFAVQALVLIRFIVTEARRSRDDDALIKKKAAIRESGEIISKIFAEGDVSDAKTGLHNQLLLTMSGTIAEDLITGVLKSTTGTNGDVGHVVRLCYELVARYGLIDLQTPEEIEGYIKMVYRQTRVLLKRNLKYVRRLTNAIMDSDVQPLSKPRLSQLLSGISCSVNKKMP